MAVMQPLVVSAADVSQMVGRLWWPSLRIGGFVLAAPIASEATIPRRVKIVLIVSLAFLMAPLAPVPTALSIFSGAGAVTAPGGYRTNSVRSISAARSSIDHRRYPAK